MIIIGGGLGGLLTAALFSNQEEVVVFERSRHLGGRFRNFDREGYSLTTGALHMLPHGSNGPVAKILGMVGAECKIVDSVPWGTFLSGDDVMRFHEIRRSLPFGDKVKVAKMLFQMRFMSSPDTSVQTYLDERFRDEVYTSMARCFLGWSLSLSPKDVMMRDLSEIVRNIYSYGGPGIPMGGCGGVIDSLRAVLQRNGARIVHDRVEKIVVEDGKAVGVETSDGTYHQGGSIVSDAGVKNTLALCPQNSVEQDFRKRVGGIRPSGGIKINISSAKPLLSDSGILFPLDSERIEGMIEATKVDSALAPNGRHLVMSHQTLNGKNIRSEVKKGICDLEEIFCGKDFEVICAQTYFGKNPVNMASQGQDLSFDGFPLENLYVVGDDVKGRGGIEVEGIALGVLDLYKGIGKRT